MNKTECVEYQTLACPLDFSTTESAVFYFRAYCIPILILIGIPSNLFVFIIFIRLQKRQPCRFNIYVLYISIAHIFQIICEALMDHFIGRGLWFASGCTLNFKLDIQSEFSCKFVSYLPTATELLAAILLVSFTIDRMVTVFRPIQSRGDINLNYARFGTLTCFLFAFIAFIPAAVFYQVQVKSDGACTCSLINPTSPGPRYVILMSVICSYTLPTIVILILNLLISYKLKFILQNRTIQSRVGYKQKLERRRILGHLGVCSFFLLISIPLVVCMVLRQYSDAKGYNKSNPTFHKEIVQLTKFFSSFTAIQYSTNIWIYLVFLPNVRSEAVRLLFGCRCLAKYAIIRRLVENHVKESASEKRNKGVRQHAQKFSEQMRSGSIKTTICLE